MAVLPIGERGFTRPELLAESEWLQDHLGDARVRIIDARPVPQYEAGHIPGAVSLSAAGSIPRAENGDMGSPEAFERLAGSLGVGDDTTVVVYDAPSATMGMVGWAFLYFGHQDTRLLDGGFEKWSREGRPTSHEATTYPEAAFHARPAEDMYCSLESAKTSLGRSNTVFWDTRTQAEYEGTAAAGATGPPRLGHLPGAVHLEWTELLDPESRTVKPAAELRELLSSKGITPESEVFSY
jgi:thiosulfate/3-mercaptopyruvate sulfurtransferase